MRLCVSMRSSARGGEEDSLGINLTGRMSVSFRFTA